MTTDPIRRNGATVYALAPDDVRPVAGRRLRLWQAAVVPGPACSTTDAIRIAQLFEAAADLADAVVFVPRARVDDADADRVERARGAVKRRVRQWFMGVRRG